MWNALTKTALAILARGCEVALDDKEAFEESEHIVPGDVKFFMASGVRCARITMRKRKDLKVLRGKQAFESASVPLSHSVLGTPEADPSRVSFARPFFSASFHCSHRGCSGCHRVPIITSHVGVRKPRLK